MIGFDCPRMGASGAGYSANAVRFDGTNDYLERGAAWTGAADGEDFIFSCWFNFKGADGAINWVLGDDNSYAHRTEIQRTAGNQIEVSTRAPSGGTYKQRIVTTGTFLLADGWKHLLVSVDSSATTQHVYINDVSDSPSASTNLTGTISFTQATQDIGKSTFNHPLNADIAELYWAPKQFLDFSNVSNRRKFIDANGKPVDLGSDGSTPTGVAPIALFTGATSGWHTNAGSGGGTTEFGALTDGTDSPSD